VNFYEQPVTSNRRVFDGNSEEIVRIESRKAGIEEFNSILIEMAFIHGESTRVFPSFTLADPRDLTIA